MRVHMMDLIAVNVTEEDKQTVNGRDLHMFLEIETPYTKWFSRMCEYGFEENLDYMTVDKNVLRSDGTIMPQRQYNHQLTLDMAKQLCMLARNEKGRQAREYFIQIERDWNSPEKVMGRALKIANNVIRNQNLTIAQQHQRLQELQPKATYYDLVLQNDSLLSITQIAKDFGLSAIRLNQILKEKGVQYKQSDQWFLYQKYADKGYTSSKTTVLDAERSVMHTYWTQKGRLFIYDLLKSIGILPLIEQVA
ncbi:MAG: phage antirepressor KilAC domain-containing protein [Veillonella caviae]|nr:phage antirepressor KilAC domain-containing protein [Veillonella caviae]